MVLSAFALWGCASAKPFPVRVDVSPTQAAELTVRTATGSKGVVTPDHCQTPCVLQVPGNLDKDVQLTLRAPGYYPAVFTVAPQSFGVFWLKHPNASFIVPLQKRADTRSTTTTRDE